MSAGVGGSGAAVPTVEGGARESLESGRGGLWTRLRRGLDAIAQGSGAIGEVRGAGLMLGIDVAPDVADRMVAAALDRGLLVNRTAGTVVRLLPPLTITDADIDEALGRLREAFADAGAT